MLEREIEIHDWTARRLIMIARIAKCGRQPERVTMAVELAKTRHRKAQALRAVLRLPELVQS